MASNEVLDAVTMHLQSILTRLQGVDPSQLPPRLSQALGPITERLSQRLQQLETDPAMQQKVVDLVTRLKNRPFPGRYEGLKTRIQGRVAANPERLCQLLQRVLESGRIQNESIRSKVQSKYQSDCLNEALPL